MGTNFAPPAKARPDAVRKNAAAERRKARRPASWAGDLRRSGDRSDRETDHRVRRFRTSACRRSAPLIFRGERKTGKGIRRPASNRAAERCLERGESATRAKERNAPHDYRDRQIPARLSLQADRARRPLRSRIQAGAHSCRDAVARRVRRPLHDGLQARISQKLVCAREALAGQRDNALNYFKVDASQPLAEWKRKGWLHQDDPRGWFQWYCRYYMGRRHGRCAADQALEGVPPPHWADQGALRKGDFSCRRRQRQALLHWAYDSRRI